MNLKRNNPVWHFFWGRRAMGEQLRGGCPVGLAVIGYECDWREHCFWLGVGSIKAAQA